MAFKRTSLSSLVKRTNNSFKVAYSFSKKVPGFKVGSDAYVIPLGLESGYYVTPCHRVLPYKAPNGELVGFNGGSFASYIKCKGIDSEGNPVESLCCDLAKKEKERIPDKENSAQRIVSFAGDRITLPVLILGSSVTDNKSGAYPVSRVSILNELRSEEGLRFAYLEMASSTFLSDIVQAYGKRLKEEGAIDYEMDESSEEFLDEVSRRLPRTIIKVHGVSRTGFSAAMKEYSFFSLDNPVVASASPAGEREAIIGYQENQEIQNKICEFLDLLNAEIDNMFKDWNEKDLLEFYNCAIGKDIHAPLEDTAPVEAAPTERVEVIQPTVNESVVSTSTTSQAVESQTATAVAEKPIKDEELDNILDDITEKTNAKEAQVDDALEEFAFDSDEDDFFGED